MTANLITRFKMALAPALFAVGLAAAAAAAAPASAAVTLVDGQESCDLYGTDGCLFSWSGGGSFDDPLQIVAAYNAAHNATPSPQDLPALTFLGKIDGAGATTQTFTDLSWDVSFYMVKAGNGNFFQFFGLPTATDSFTAKNTLMANNNGKLQNISHVTFFSAPSVPTGAVPEPMTWAMMIGGFFATGAMLRRRQPVLAA